MSLKEITDAEKPWFDYVAYLLRIAAWTLAIVYASHQQLRPRPPGAGFPVFEWIGIFLAGLFMAFLILRFIIMSAKMVGHITKEAKDNFFNRRVLIPLTGLWLLFGMPAFTTAVSVEFVELYLERFLPEKPRTDTGVVAPDVHLPASFAGPWERQRSNRACPSGTTISGTGTLCPIVPIEWY